MDWIQNIDTEIFLNLNHIRTEFADSFLTLFTGKLIWIPLYAAILFTLCKDFRWQQTLIYIVGIALMITLADQICSHLIRPLVARPRPSNALSPIVDMVQLAPGYRAGGKFGFPSCHAANTMALAMLVSLVVKRRAITLFMFGWAFVTCYSRIYLGAHYPGDLLVGSIIGILLAWGVYKICNSVAKRWLGNAFIEKERKTPLIQKYIGKAWQYPSNSIIFVGSLTVIYMIIASL